MCKYLFEVLHFPSHSDVNMIYIRVVALNPIYVFVVDHFFRLFGCLNVCFELFESEL